MSKYLAPFLFGTVSMLGMSTAMAQSTGLEEVVVTARKRTESLQDVPVAVSAISPTEIRNNNVTSLQKISEIAPQVSIGRAVTGTGAILTIRGISSASTDSGLDQSVSMSIDGVSLSRGRIIQTAFFDMQQIEVMQGPQALFFGKNSPAGVISITSKEPTDKVEGHLMAGYEFEAKEKYVEGVVSGPLSSVLKARVAMRYSAMDGWIKNVAVAEPNPFQPFAPVPGATQGDHQPMGNNLAGRATLVYEPTDDFTAKLKVTMNREKTNSNAAGDEEFCTNGQTVPTVLGVQQTHSDCLANQVVAHTAYPAQLAVNYPYAKDGVPYAHSALTLTSLALEKKINDVTLTSVTGYYDQSHKGSFNGDRTEYSQIFDTEAERYRMFNEEFRVNTDFAGPLNGMAGLYFEDAHRRWFNAPSILNVFDPVHLNYASTVVTSQSHNKSFSVFGQLRWKIIPELELAGGVRYTHDVKDTTLLVTQENLATGTGRGGLPEGVPLPIHYSGNNASPDITLTWKPTRNQTIYAGYKTGYKSGGISNPAVTAASMNAANLTFGPEHAKGFEVGYKADLLANTMRFDIVGYRYNYNGLQVSAYDSVRVAYSIRNAAKARTYGISSSLQWLVTDRLTLDGNIGWNHARFLSFPNAQCFVGQPVGATACDKSVIAAGAQDLSGKPLDRAPNVTFKIGADYKMDLAGGWTADFAVSAYHSSSYESAADRSYGSLQSAYWLINAAVHLTPENEKFRLSLIGRDLNNAYYKTRTNTRSLGTPYEYSGGYNRPREVVIEAQYNF
jgi:outer membrane receptor protein involved in Fe transport